MTPRESRLEPTPALGDLIEILLRRKLLIATVTLVAVAAAVLYTFARQPVYTATAGVFVRPAFVSPTSSARPPDIDSQTEVNLATSVAVATIAKRSMDSSLSPRELLNRVTANMVTGTQYLTISFSDHRPTTAKLGAKAFADAYLAYRRDEALTVFQQQRNAISAQAETSFEEVRSLTARLEKLGPGAPARLRLELKRDLEKDQIRALQVELAAYPVSIPVPGEVIDPPSLPDVPVSPRHAFDIALGVIVGLGIGVAIALIRERSNDVVRTAVELEDRLEIPVVGSIPRMRRRASDRTVLGTPNGKRTIDADAHRRLRTSLLGMAEHNKMKTILVTSALGGEGKSSTVANLGAGLAEIGKKVIVVSADLRRPALQRMFSTTPPIGLSQALSNGLAASEVVTRTLIPNLRLVPSGALKQSTEPVNLLQSEGMRVMLAEWSEEADFVLVDSPAVLSVSDPLVLARLVNGVLLVVNAGRSRWEDVILSRNELERAGGILLATVLNGVVVSRRDRRAWSYRPTSYSSATTKRSEKQKARF